MIIRVRICIIGHNSVWSSDRWPKEQPTQQHYKHQMVVQPKERQKNNILETTFFHFPSGENVPWICFCLFFPSQREGEGGMHLHVKLTWFPTIYCIFTFTNTKKQRIKHKNTKWSAWKVDQIFNHLLHYHSNTTRVHK